MFILYNKFLFISRNLTRILGSSSAHYKPVKLLQSRQAHGLLDIQHEAI